ncbi:MAG: NUDIX domain-containing protein [Clostridia bacterium]|nr:NUDIX domain-containing protein [Clostridia bacterium]
MEERNDWSKSVTGVVIKDNKVLLARHTYGAGRGKLIIPGGYLLIGESAEAAVVREYAEETGVTVKPVGVIGIRFTEKEWYAAFLLEYVEGEAHSDGDENDEVVWMDTEEALIRDDVPDLTKKLIRSAISKNCAMIYTDFTYNKEKGIQTLYCK